MAGQSRTARCGCQVTDHVDRYTFIFQINLSLVGSSEPEPSSTAHRNRGLFMAISDWLHTHGETAQYVAFFGLLALLIPLERVVPGRRAGPRARRFLANFALTALNVVVLGALPVTFVGAALWARERGWGFLNLGTGALVGAAATMALRGFISWLTHLLMHKVPLFWRVHRVHHTDTDLDVSTTVRFHPLEFLIGVMIGAPMVVVFGLDPMALVAYEILDAAVTVFSHANIRLPRSVDRVLRYLLVTPDLHRVHHSTNPEETDSNFSAVFPIWDLIFGTMKTRPREKLATMPMGLEEVRDDRSHRLFWLLAVPFLGRLDREPRVSPRARAQLMESGT